MIIAERVQGAREGKTGLAPNTLVSLCSEKPCGCRDTRAFPTLLFGRKLTMGTFKQNGWYRRKLYSHFDTPLSFEAANEYVSDPTKVAQHPFLPFLSFALEKRRIHKKPKSRPIKYASHVDGYIFSYYAHELTEKYEALVTSTGLDSAVLAYRSGRGDNISFAKESFEEIQRLGTCVALGFDIAGFFDNIDHAELKRQWARVLGARQLPPDHYAVFRAITKYSYVDREACFDRLGYSMERRKKPGRICTISHFRTVIRGSGLVQVNKVAFGIPQGSALSAVLANIFMYPFDLKMQEIASSIGGIYRRYCDDILFVAPLDKEETVRDSVRAGLGQIGSQLQIQDDKTISAHFVRNPDGEIVLRDRENPFQYLGFTFDGKCIRMRAQTLSRFWRRAKHGVKKAKEDANFAALKGRDGTVFRRKLYRKFSHLGRSNFLTYARRAAAHMEPGNYKKSPAWKQVKNHWERLETLINDE